MSRSDEESNQPAFRYIEFTQVTSRKKRKAKPSSNSVPASVSLQRCQLDLTRDEWFTRCKCLLQEALATKRLTSLNVLCLGLGSPSSSRDAMAQLAFLLQVCEDLGIDTTRISLYDPVFTDDDKQLFAARNLRVLTENRHAEYSVDVPTLFYMPHCDLNLYENVCRANWSRDRLCRVVFVANAFSEYVDNKSTRELEGQAPCLLLLGE